MVESAPKQSRHLELGRGIDDNDFCLVLLKYFKWNEELVSQKYFEDELLCRKNVGLIVDNNNINTDNNQNEEQDDESSNFSSHETFIDTFLNNNIISLATNKLINDNNKNNHLDEETETNNRTNTDSSSNGLTVSIDHDDILKDKNVDDAETPALLQKLSLPDENLNDIIEENKLMDRVPMLQGQFQKRLNMLEDIDIVGEARGIGLMGAVEVVHDK
jgi:hypothetical protein